MKKLKLGVIGMSEGNGHPYSWSAIFNGYEENIMQECPFPSIPDYLSNESYPQNFLCHLAEVTHIWAQSPEISNHIAKASKIKNVVAHYSEMIGAVDAILLARDDAENHHEMTLPFLKAGIPIFIDKPFALSLNEANQMINAQQYNYQIFTCSSLRYAKELFLSETDKETIGSIYHVDATVMKYWETYAIHLLEPIIVNLPNRGVLKRVDKIEDSKMHHVAILWEEVSAAIKVTGNRIVPLEFTYYGSKGTVKKVFIDSFACFKASLFEFIQQIKNQENSISRKDTLELVDIIEKGR